MGSIIAMVFKYLASNPQAIEAAVAEVPAIIQDVEQIAAFVKSLQEQAQAPKA